MKLRNLKVATFENAAIEALMDDINNWTSGVAVTGPPAFAAGFVAEQTFSSIQFFFDGTTYTALVAYTEV